MYKILAIEKNLLFLQVIEEWLTLYGFNLITAETLDEAYKLADLEKPDLILCGYGFPKFEGFRLLQRLQNHPKTSKIPFLLMTGSFLEDIPDCQAHLKQGDLLFKPFELNVLIQSLHLKLQYPQTQ